MFRCGLVTDRHEAAVGRDSEYPFRARHPCGCTPSTWLCVTLPQLVGRRSLSPTLPRDQENGKNRTEALASIAKGNETVEWACSLPQLISGRVQEVSRGITCHDVREPIGVVASICPFNFPVMVPMWTVPIALCTGNWYGVRLTCLRCVCSAAAIWQLMVGVRPPVPWVCACRSIGDFGWHVDSP